VVAIKNMFKANLAEKYIHFPLSPQAARHQLGDPKQEQGGHLTVQCQLGDANKAVFIILFIRLAQSCEALGPKRLWSTNQIEIAKAEEWRMKSL